VEVADSLWKDVAVTRLDPRRFDAVLDPAQGGRFLRWVEQAADRLEGRRLWHLNSTEQGGGVAEMLQFLLGYLAGAGIDARWAVLGGDERFFEVTKRLHNLLHGHPGDGNGLDRPERDLYQQTLQEAVQELRQRVAPGDVVFLHDPQTVGLAPTLKGLGASVIWSCHVGVDHPNELVTTAWEFLRPYVQAADAYVFSRRAYCWEGLDPGRLAVIAPCIDAFAPKNQFLDRHSIDAILQAAGILEHRDPDRGQPAFHRLDGSRARVGRRADLLQEAPLPTSAPIVLQVSRWDRLKDHVGVLHGFVDHVADGLGAHLVLAGPAADSVRDDPEGTEVLRQVQQAWSSLPGFKRARVHLACLPMDDLEENGAIVNALQRRADVIVQKSLAEGFGLTVTEAMWKARPIVASQVGGIQDQITHGHSGLLVPDPTDLRSFGGAVRKLLADPERALQMGTEAHRRVCEEYLAPRRLTQEMELIEQVAG
jgi:trehalose synthase